MFWQRNLGLKTLALVLSMFLWAFVRFTQTPFSSTIDQADLQVPLEVITDPDKVALDAPAYVTVTVRGPKEAITSLSHNAVSTNVDLKGKETGVYAIRVTVTAPPELKVIQVDEERPPIRLESLVTQNFPIEVHVGGKPAGGYTAASPTVQEASAAATGPSAFVAQIKHVVAMVDVTRMQNSIVQRVALQAVDDEGKPVARVDVVPANAMVTVNILPDIQPRLLPVFPTLQGSVGKGFATRIRWTPRLAPVIFKKGKADSATALYTDPVDVSKLGPGEHELTATIQVPPDATLVKDHRVTIVVTVGHGASKGKK